MIKASQVKKLGREMGADIVGIGSMDRFEGAPAHMDPRFIFPEASAVIGLGFRLQRGLFRGIEEGTHFGIYPSMGYASINIIHGPIVLRALSCFIEDNGYEAVPYPNIYSSNSVNISTGEMKEDFSRPVAPGRPAPDVLLNFRIAAFICGMGEIGYSNMVLTPEFGPRQRFAFVFTDAPLDPDPLFEGGLCDRCLLCAKDCSGEAISTSETESIDVAGHTLEWGKYDVLKCSTGYTGGKKETNPFWMGSEDPEWSTEMDGGYRWKKFRGLFGNNPAIEGARGCIRACMIHLEERGKLKNRFNAPFRRRKPWKL